MQLIILVFFQIIVLWCGLDVETHTLVFEPLSQLMVLFKKDVEALGSVTEVLGCSSFWLRLCILVHQDIRCHRFPYCYTFLAVIDCSLTLSPTKHSDP